MLARCGQSIDPAVVKAVCTIRSNAPKLLGTATATLTDGAELGVVRPPKVFPAAGWTAVDSGVPGDVVDYGLFDPIGPSDADPAGMPNGDYDDAPTESLCYWLTAGNFSASPCNRVWRMA
jgi:hypothetical protein